MKRRRRRTTINNCKQQQEQQRQQRQTNDINKIDKQKENVGWKTLSSAVWKGGFQSLKHNKSSKVCIFNYKVPTTYDGLNPEPKRLLRTAMHQQTERDDNNDNDENMSQSHTTLNENTTVATMTAASMKSLCTASRSAGGILVDVIVTAGISNARAAGSDADVFPMFSPEQQEEKENQHDAATSSSPPPPGTINTIVVVNGAQPLSESAMVEAYAIVLEAKCAACADLSLACANKSLYGNDLAQGTGTDCAVLVCPLLTATNADNNNESSNDGTKKSDVLVLEYAGKHCLVAELIGQAVREATRAAIVTTIRHTYGSEWFYHIHRWKRYCVGLLLRGARPCVPSKPMDPVPSAPWSVLVLGWSLVAMTYFVGLCRGWLPRSATVLVAAACWDRCLPEPPLSVHPVVLAGTTISIVTKKWIPDAVYKSPVLGFCGGLVFLIGTLALFVSGAHFVLRAARYGACSEDSNTGCEHNVLVWILEVVLFKTTFSLQLLCTIALQMARFLERSQLKEARSQLSWLCSRDPTHLGSEELAGGTLESLAENLSDGTVAPWFWYILFGPIGALGYRIANTLDSRIGYRGGKFEWFGKASARFDDLINLIPARVTALFLCAAAALVPPSTDGSKNSGRASRPLLGLWTAWQDSSQCDSPNAGWPMAAMAGIISVRLEKKGQYCLGETTIPSARRGPTPRDIRLGHHVAQLAGGIALLIAVAACIFKEWIMVKNECMSLA